MTRFLRFPLEGKSKTPKNCVSPRREKQKHPKTAFPPRGKIKITQKLRFPPEGKAKTLKNCLSATAEDMLASKTLFSLCETFRNKETSLLKYTSSENAGVV